MTAAPITRWTPSKKAALVEAIRRREILPASAMRDHGISEEELESWLRRHDRFGVAGLSVRRLQEVGR